MYCDIVLCYCHFCLSFFCYPDGIVASEVSLRDRRIEVMRWMLLRISPSLNPHCPHSQNQERACKQLKACVDVRTCREKRFIFGMKMSTATETYNLINCLQVGAIIWYCVFIWMEHACCLSVKVTLLFTFILFLNVKKELIRFVLFLMGSTCALTWNTNK